MIFVAGISIALLISALLFVKEKKSQSDKILFCWMLLNAIHLFFFYSLHNGSIYDYPVLLGLQFPLPLLHGVLLYFYVSTVTQQIVHSRFSILLHLVPSILTFLYLIPFFILPSERKIEIFKRNGEGYETFLMVILYAVFISGIVYVVWSSLILRDHKKRIRNQFSNIEEINLKWLKFLTYGLGAIWSLVIFIQNDFLIFIGVSIFVILIGFFGLQQKNIFASTKAISYPSESTLNSSSEKPVEIQKKKYSSSSLSEEAEEKYHKKLTALMVDQKIYKNAELSLSDLASNLEIHPNYLSQIINKRETKAFYDYVNWYRVEEFKRLIAIPDNKQFTLMSLAYDCGFNSKSSFNRYFKKISGKTPTQYSKELVSLNKQ